MLPTLREGDRLLVLHGGRPRPGGLVVVRLPAYGGVGEPAGDGGSGARPGRRGVVVAVKRAAWRDPGGWWVERDNPHEGVDSWSVGPVAETDVIAVVVCRGPRALARGAWMATGADWRRVVRHIRRRKG